MTPCPECKSERTGVLETRKTARGMRRRRYECQCCRYRWTTFVTNGKESAQQHPGVNKGNTAQRRLSREEAGAVITSPLPQRELAVIYGITRQAISRIQTGQQYRDIYQEIHPPRQGPILHCVECLHWRGEGCGLEFPEAGGDFASDCAAYA